MTTTFQTTAVIGSDGTTGEKRLKLRVPETTKLRNVPTNKLGDNLKAAFEAGKEGDEFAVTVEGTPGQPKLVELSDLFEARAARAPENPSRIDPSLALYPYNFVPAWRSADHEQFGDRDIAGHGYAHEGTLSGTIVVRLTCETPALLLDDVADPSNGPAGHLTYSVRTGPDGTPILPVTSVKGVLRSMIEAVTGSRFGTWSSKLDDPLAYREAATAKEMRLARVASVDDEGAELDVYGGVDADKGFQAAAWLPAYGLEVRDEYGQQPQHGAAYWAELVPIQHERNDKGGWIKDVKMWRVSALATSEEALQRTKRVSVVSQGQKSRYTQDGDPIVQKGFAFVTGKSFARKHDERFAFGAIERVHVDRSVVRGYEAVLEAYHRAAADTSIKMPNGVQPGVHRSDKKPKKLASEDWLLVEVSNGQVASLSPVFIGRKPWDVSPSEIAAACDLLPATTPSELSPAERMFGFVGGAENKTFARRGSVRLASSRCLSAPEAAVQRFDAIPLAILGEPKPVQGRFYAAADPSGKPVADRANKATLYRSGGGLRGRKFYWHHKTVERRGSYWDPTGDPKDLLNDHRREFLHGDGARSNRNRSIDSWVPIGTTFRVEIRFEDLEPHLLGALLWCVAQPDIVSTAAIEPAGRVRLGYGKPLGFGSMATEIDLEASSIVDADSRWDSFDTTAETLTSNRVDELVSEFLEVLPEAGRASANALSALLQGMANRAVAYPSVEGHGTEGFTWFVNNERGPKVALPSPTATEPALDVDLPQKQQRFTPRRR